jgi:O-antigen biosynthesis protein
MDGLNYFRQLLLQWSKFRKRILTTGQVANSGNLIYSSNGQRTSIAFKSVLSPRWYMLEVKIKLPMARIKGSVNIINASKKSPDQPVAFVIHSERLCKRLLYSESGGKLELHLELAEESFELQYFRLVRVTRKFAQSRIIKKLHATHPHYKTRRDSSPNNNVSFRLASANDLPRLWADYCALFEENAEIMPYSIWIGDFDRHADVHRTHLRTQTQHISYSPLISIVMPVHNPNPVWLSEAIESVRQQIYLNWELCVADDASSDPTIRAILENYVLLDKRIKVVFREDNGHISEASNSAFTLVKGDWVALLDHDDLLAENALFWAVDAINRNPNISLIYSDEDKCDEDGKRSEPYFKCDWNQDLFYSQNMFSHLGLYKASLVREVGGFRIGYEGSQDYDLALRCVERVEANQIHHIPRVLYHWRIHENSTAQSNDAKPYALVAGERALNDHFQRRNIIAKAYSVGHGYRVRYELPSQQPLVSIIIPTNNKAELLKKCIDSILRKTEYENYEIIIMDNGSDEKKAISYLKKLVANSKIRIIKDISPFNYSKLNNDAVRVANGDVIALLNNDVEVINADWLTEMVSHAMRPEVGVVGAKLYYSDDTIQHAGVVLGIHGIAGHVHRFLPRDNVGYCGRANLIQSFSAVTGACLVVKKSTYQLVGGLNDLDLTVACNDIDFCLKVREAGYRNIWTPYAELYHHESASRGFDDTPEKLARSAKEVAYMQQRWGDLIKNDPAYSPNLSLDFEDFSLAWPPRLDGYNVN